MAAAIAHPPRGIRVIAVAASTVLLAVACGAGATTAPAGPTTVDVTLQEWAVLPSTTTIKAGMVTFNAKNDGPVDTHEFVIIRTDLGARNLPVNAAGKVDEAGAGVQAIGEIEEFGVGESKSATFDLSPGKYVFICNIVDADGDAHYAKGMSIEVNVE